LWQKHTAQGASTDNRNTTGVDWILVE